MTQPKTRETATARQHRRLLNNRETAERLGRSYDWFMRHKEELQRLRNFPRPVLGTARFGRAVYDPGAIDAWLDSLMDPALRNATTTARAVGDAATDWEAVLLGRLTDKEPPHAA